MWGMCYGYGESALHAPLYTVPYGLLYAVPYNLSMLLYMISVCYSVDAFLYSGGRRG